MRGFPKPVTVLLLCAVVVVGAAAVIYGPTLFGARARTEPAPRQVVEAPSAEMPADSLDAGRGRYLARVENCWGRGCLQVVLPPIDCEPNCGIRFEPASDCVSRDCFRLVTPGACTPPDCDIHQIVPCQGRDCMGKAYAIDPCEPPDCDMYKVTGEAETGRDLRIEPCSPPNCD